MDLTAAVRTPGYLKILVFAALLGVPVSLAALAFVQLVHWAEHGIWISLPSAMGFSEPPWWLILLVPTVAGVAVAFARKLPGDGGHHPLVGFAGGPTLPSYLPGVLLAAFFTLSSGIILGPEAPLVALGGGLAAWAGSRAAKKNEQALPLLVMCGSMAAISAIFGNPLAAAILLVEALALGGPLLAIALLPGLLSAGVGYLVFTGVNSWTGIAPPTLTLPVVPPGGVPRVEDILWAVVVGAVVALLMVGLRTIAEQIEKVGKKVQPIIMLPICGLAVGILAVTYQGVTGETALAVMFSGETAVGPLGAEGTTISIGVLAALVIFKSVGYAISLGSGFRGGPIFPSLFIGAAFGMIAGRVLPGMSPLAGFAAGMAASTAAMMRLPLATLVIVALLTGAAGLQVLPIVIIATVVGVVVRALTDPPTPAPAAAPTPATT